MVIDRAMFDLLRDKYRVREIETSYEPVSTYSIGGDHEVKMRLSMCGFGQLVRDLFDPNSDALDVRDMFDVSHIATNKGGVLVAKYPMEKHPPETIARYGEKLKKTFEQMGCQVILMPNTFDVSVLGVEQLAQIRDSLTELIKNLSYDNIIGF